MSEKSYVTLLQRVCYMCEKTYDTGELAIDKRLKPRFDRHEVVGYGICPDDLQKLKDQNLVAIIGPPEEGHQDVMFVCISDRAFAGLFTIEIPEEKVVMAERSVIIELFKMIEDAKES